MPHKMTPEELELAQFALNAFQRAQQLADRTDPKRKRLGAIAHRLDGVAHHAADLYLALTGRIASGRESLVDLNTEHPAPWTRTVTQYLDKQGE